MGVYRIQAMKFMEFKGGKGRILIGISRWDGVSCVLVDWDVV